MSAGISKSRYSLAVVLVLLIVLSGIWVWNSASPTPETENPPLNFRISWKAYSGRGEAIQKIVNIYNTGNSATRPIVMVSGDEDRASISTLLETPDSDTVLVLPYRYVQYFGVKGYLADLSTDFEDDQNLYYPIIWQLATVEGTTYGIPWMGHSICLLYNKKILAEASVDAASINSLPSLVQAIEAVEARTDARGIGMVGADHNDVSWMVNQFIYGFGSSLVNEDGTKVTVNNEQSRAALEFYKNVLGKHAQPTWVNDTGVEVMDYFRQQKIAFEFQGIWGVSDIEKNGQPFEVGVIALEDIGLCSEIGPMMLSIPASMSADNQAEAIHFIRYLISTEAQEKIMDGEYSPEHDSYYPFRTPIRKDLADSIFPEKYPQYLPFLTGFKQPSIDVPAPKWQIVKDSYYQPELHRLMNDEISIDDFLQKIESQGNEVLNSP